MKPDTIENFLRVRRGLIGVAAGAACALATSAQADSSRLWQADVYYPIGSVVSYRDRLYEARVSQVDFQGSERNPTVATLWKAVGAAAGVHLFNLRASWFARTSNTVESRCAPAWNRDNTYTTGGLASVDGINYRANWWTHSELPVTHSSAGGPWTLVGSCAASSKTAASSPGPETRSGSVVQAQTEAPRG